MTAKLLITVLCLYSLSLSGSFFPSDDQINIFAPEGGIGASLRFAKVYLPREYIKNSYWLTVPGFYVDAGKLSAWKFSARLRYIFDYYSLGKVNPLDTINRAPFTLSMPTHLFELGLGYRPLGPITVRANAGVGMYSAGVAFSQAPAKNKSGIFYEAGGGAEILLYDFKAFSLSFPVALSFQYQLLTLLPKKIGTTTPNYLAYARFDKAPTILLLLGARIRQPGKLILKTQNGSCSGCEECYGQINDAPKTAATREGWKGIVKMSKKWKSACWEENPDWAAAIDKIESRAVWLIENWSLDSIEYNTAYEAGTIEELQSYVFKYPNGRFVQDARNALDVLKTKEDMEAYKRATANGYSYSAYMEYLNQHPNGEFAMETQKEINEKENLARLEYGKAKKDGLVENYQIFLDKFGNTGFADSASAALVKVRAEKFAYETITKSESYAEAKQFIREHPLSGYSRLLKEWLKKRRR